MRILISNIENELGRKLAADFAGWGFDVYALACNKAAEKLSTCHMIRVKRRIWRN